MNASQHTHLEHHPFAVVTCPMAGEVMRLSEVDDRTFSSGRAGEGVGIRPEPEPTVVVAPLAGKLIQVWPQEFIVLSDSGVAVLVHLGMGTGSLHGRGFVPIAVEGDRVHPGFPVITYDVPTVMDEGWDPTIVVLAADIEPDRVNVVAIPGASIETGETLFTIDR